MAVSQGFRDSVEALAADVDTIVDRSLTRNQASYALVPRSAVEVSARMNLDVVCDSLLAGRPVVVERDVEALAVRIDERVGQGLRVQDAMQGLRTSLGIMQERFVEIATERAVSPVELLGSTQILWALSDALTDRVGELFQRRSISDALRDSHLRSAFLRELLAGQLTPAMIDERVRAFGLDAGAAYRAVKASPAPGSSLEVLRRRLEARSADVVGIDAGSCIGVVSGTADAPGLEATVALGPAAELAEVAASFDVAQRVHDWMWRRGIRGRRSIEDVGWRLAVDRDDAVTTLLRHRYRAPLDELGEFGVLIWRSVRAYVEADRNVARASTALVVHQNTLRYRLARFAAVTGADLDSTDTLLEVTWVLAAEVGEERER
ncbi:PucR family transcriptional regulator [Pseudonocardia broussonetiae]|uniref:Helix-turn-helix domain-containing protein n=1 Tax=Pseudonocardia broussonetiae TaxID=2736640 RepID=A0A6M6JNE4_9PSEU|nr:helix-turn-helix domain-containing protein [Pseudonocardia broussonetiae]QJY48865.1 helix-turn-helix domain-containing protein [Pseudonocardia broussonetiae]